MKHFVATQSDIKSGAIFEKKIADQTLVFVRYQNEIKAYSGICPHQGAKLANGVIENDAIVCPLHHRAYACKNGYDIKTHTVLKSFPVVEEGNEVYVHVESAAESTDPAAKCTRTINDLPQPKGLPILGNLQDFSAENKPKILEDWAKKNGSVFKISLLGKKFVVSTDPDFNIHLYKNRPDKFRRFGKIEEVIAEMGIDGVFSAEGEQWKVHRKLTAEALNTRNVYGFFPTTQEVTERLLRRWNQKQEFTVDIQKELMRYTVDLTTRIAFGYDTHALEHEDDELQSHLERVFPMINKRMTSPIPFWRIFKTKEDRELDKSLAALQKTILEFIQKAKKRLEEHPELKERPENFLQALLVEKEKTGSFSDYEIYGNVFILLLAGEDTTSNTISWALFYLMQNPHIFAKLREEADAVIGTAPYIQDVEQLASLKYAEAVIMEALRIRPVTPTLFLESMEDQVVNGLMLKKGVTVMMQIKVAQTSDEHFTQSAEFIPERWLAGSDMPLHNTDAFRTFGAGPRFCPGKTLAMHEMKMGLSMIVKNFDIELAVDPSEVREKFAFTMYPDNLMLRIKPRKY